MIGVLTIPKIDVRLPIYHGTSEETIAKGVGHVSDTAFPMDTVGTKSVLTGHNGMPGADMLFTRLDETKIGDTFVIQIGDVGYHYVVKQMTVITPEEAEVYAQEPINSNDPANVTLITCTPYGINSHRLLVIGEFVKKANVEEDKTIIPQTHFSLGKETIVILFVTTMGLGLIAYVVKKTVDKNKTNGALKWIKTTNGGNQGWEVLIGDTGWRTLNSVSRVGNSFIKIRRVNNLVTYQFGGLQWGWFGVGRRNGPGFVRHNSSGDKGAKLTYPNGIPEGFRSENSLVGPTYDDKGRPYGIWYLGGKSDLNFITI